MRISTGRRWLAYVGAMTLGVSHALTMAGEAPSARPSTADALNRLREGNTRFLSGESQSPNLTPERLREAAEQDQRPFATILTCADSRIPVERLFDQGVGDVFVVRVAGNVADTDEIGSIEYGVGHLRTPLVVVMGHTRCGAVSAVLSGAETHGSIAPLVDNIRPAVEWVQRNRPELGPEEMMAAAIEANVWQSIDDLLTHSAETRALVEQGSVTVVGAVYDLATGHVRFMGEHPYQERIIASAVAQPEGAGHAAAPPAAAPVSPPSTPKVVQTQPVPQTEPLPPADEEPGDAAADADEGSDESEEWRR